MAKKPSKKRKTGKKRGPKEERLRIDMDPQTALDRLLGKKPTPGN